jgi:chromosome segregation ATPase
LHSDLPSYLARSTNEDNLVQVILLEHLSVVVTSTMSSSQPGAMALLEKYTALNRGMDEARREASATKSKMESVRQQIDRLRVERRNMEAQTQDAKEDTVGLHKDVQEALAKLRELEDRHAQALLNKMEAQRRLDFTKQYVEEQRQQFLETSRDFRTCCKRVRLSTSAIGEDLVISKAFLERHGAYYSEDEESDEKDTEFDQTMVEHRRRKSARDGTERVLRAIQVKEKDSSERSASRSERKSQLLAQLDRVRKDNADLEQQLKSLDHQTREAREMSHNLEKGKLEYIVIFYFDSHSFSTIVYCFIKL